ncbi:MAG: hypothetical protein JSS39_00870 [Nitrospira sp.]|nr:hypothetical protein [Nitrospira sp.]
MRQLVGALLFAYILILSWTGSAEALGTFTCSSPCVNGDSEVGNGLNTTDPMTISNAVAGHPILVAIRSGGQNPSNPTIINGGGNPGTLRWTLLNSQKPVGSDWVHVVYCAIVPTNGTYTFSATNNALGVRAWTAHYNTGTCSGALTHSSSSVSTSISSGTVTTSGSAVIFSAIASDTDIDGQGGSRTFSGGTIRNNNCNVVAGLEPDQKGCIGDRGIQAAGTYNAAWTVGRDIWVAIIVALPTSGAGGTLPPAAPMNLTVR